MTPDIRMQFVPRRPTVTGHVDGLALRMGAEVVVSGDEVTVVTAFRAAREGLAMLAACLANARTQGDL